MVVSWNDNNNIDGILDCNAYYFIFGFLFPIQPFTGGYILLAVDDNMTCSYTQKYYTEPIIIHESSLKCGYVSSIRFEGAIATVP